MPEPNTIFARLWHRLAPTDSRLIFILTVIVGILSGLAAVAFHSSIDWVDHHVLGAVIGQQGMARAVSLFVVLGGVGLAVGLLLQFAFPYARGSGIPEVKYEYATATGPRLSGRTVVGKFLLGALSIGAGFSLGREGPTVQICAGIGVAVGRLTRQGPRVARQLACIGAAAGIAAAFNTPIAAITFVLEEIVGDLNQRLLGAIVVATVAAAVVEHAILGGQPVFAVPAYALGAWWELVGYALLGVLCAIGAVIFVKGLLWTRAAVRSWTAVPSWAKPAAGGMLVALIGVAFPAALGIGYSVLSDALLGRMALPAMASLSVVKLAATVVSYGFGLAGGIFAPSLYMGGMLGGAVGGTLHHWVPQNPNVVGSFALVGMGAFFAGAIRAPITSILIIFEMTGDYAIILPLMIANMISYTLASHWQRLPIYDALLEQDGLHIGDHDAAVFKRTTVERAMTRAALTAIPGESTASALARLDDLGVNALPVVNAAGVLVGIVSRKDLLSEKARGATIEAVMTRRPITIFADQTIDAALQKMGRHAIRQLPVVARSEPHVLAGILSLRDIAARAQE